MKSLLERIDEYTGIFRKVNFYYDEGKRQI